MRHRLPIALLIATLAGYSGTAFTAGSGNGGAAAGGDLGCNSSAKTPGASIAPNAADHGKAQAAEHGKTQATAAKSGDGMERIEAAAHSTWDTLKLKVSQLFTDFKKSHPKPIVQPDDRRIIGLSE